MKLEAGLVHSRTRARGKGSEIEGVLSVKIPGWEGVSIINRHHVNITPIVSRARARERGGKPRLFVLPNARET